MKKVLLVVVASVFLAGCSDSSDGKPYAVGEKCIKGVVYYNSGYKLAPAFKTDGTLYKCGHYVEG